MPEGRGGSAYSMDLFLAEQMFARAIRVRAARRSPSVLPAVINKFSKEAVDNFTNSMANTCDVQAFAASLFLGCLRNTLILLTFYRSPCVSTAFFRAVLIGEGGEP